MDQISIIVPVYNVERYLPRCLNSIISQSRRNLEILLIDDGSSDSSGNICDIYAEKDIRIKVDHTENWGLSAARNRGLELAQGDYISFVDSDDWLDASMLEVLMSLIKKSEVEIAECGYWAVEKDRFVTDCNCKGTISIVDGKEAVRRLHMWKGFRSVVWNKLYNRKTIGELRFPTGKKHEDEFFTWRCMLQANRLLTVDLALYHYNRVRNGRITDKHDESDLDGLEAFEDRIDYIWKCPELSDLIESINNAYISTASHVLERCHEQHIYTQRMQEALNNSERICEFIISHEMPVELTLLETLQKVIARIVGEESVQVSE